jgi:hypothetical protein
MGQHLRAKLGPAGRVELARLQLDEGAASESELASGAWAWGRSSRPHRCPRQSLAGGSNTRDEKAGAGLWAGSPSASAERHDQTHGRRQEPHPRNHD